MKPFENYSLTDIPFEVWRDIPNYEGTYQISNMGRVKSKNRVNFQGKKLRCKILRQSKNPKGYYSVVLFKNGKRNRSVVARLVASAFLPNPNGKPCVDHIDNVKSNNLSSNLRWVDYSENMNNPISILQRKSTTKGRNFRKEKGLPPICGAESHSAKKIVRIDLSINKVYHYSYMKEAEKDGYKFCSVSLCCRKLKTSYKGQLFFYENDYIENYNLNHIFPDNRNT